MFVEIMEYFSEQEHVVYTYPYVYMFMMTDIYGIYNFRRRRRVLWAAVILFFAVLSLSAICSVCFSLLFVSLLLCVHETTDAKK